MPGLSREGVKVSAVVGGYRSRAFKVLDVETSSGGDKLDHAVILFDLGDPEVKQYVANIDLAKLIFSVPGANQINLQGIDISIVAEINGEEQVWHWGKATMQELEIGPNESIKLISRLENAHFGRPTDFRRVYNRASESHEYIDHYITFNPDVKGGIIGNRNPNPGSRRDGIYPVFVEPASMKTANAAAYHGVDWLDPNDPANVFERAEQNWNLIEAVLYLCGECNLGQTYIKNPTEDELGSILDSDRTILKNHIIRPGLHLPEALDQLLNPYGYHWRIDYKSLTERKIVVFQAGVGTEHPLLLQGVGSSLIPSQSNTLKVSLGYDASMAINQVRATGGFTELEHTWELKPAWSASFDDSTIDMLNTGAPDWETRPIYHRIWRDWVLDEAGDYGREWAGMPANAPNPLVSAAFITAFGAAHSIVVPKRRKFLPMLTRGDDNVPLGKVGGCVVEWFNPDEGEGGSWVPLDPNLEFFTCRLLEDECGIHFAGSVPPIFLMNLGTAARVRITATVQSDYRIAALETRKTTSVNPDVNEATLDVSSRFHGRLLHPESKYFGDVAGGTLRADTSDGRAALEDFVEAARLAFDRAQCSGTAVIAGIDYPEYKVGDLVPEVVGREVLFGLNHSASEERRFPQIMGIVREVQSQRTIITLNEFKDTTAWVASFLRKTKRLK